MTSGPLAEVLTHGRMYKGVDSGDALGMAEHVVSQQTAVENRIYGFTDFWIYGILDVRSSDVL